MWNQFMKEALKKQPLGTFRKPEPVVVEKPVLRGEYPETHTILYYVDPEDPTGPPPANPARISQFPKWEAAVQLWARNYLPPVDPNASSTDPNASSTPPMGSGTTPGEGETIPPIVPTVPPVPPAEDQPA
jgi:hypothetical protein